MDSFPLIKLVFLAFRQLSGPVSSHIQRAAKKSTSFRRFINAPAHWFYKLELMVKMNAQNMGHPRCTPKMTEETATELGAQLLGELSLFSLGALIAYAEFKRQANNDLAKAMKKALETDAIRASIDEITKRIFERQLQIDALQKVLSDKFKSCK